MSGKKNHTKFEVSNVLLAVKSDKNVTHVNVAMRGNLKSMRHNTLQERTLAIIAPRMSI